MNKRLFKNAGILFACLSIFTTTLVSCSSDDASHTLIHVKSTKPIQTFVNKEVVLDPKITNQEVTYSWTLNGKHLSNAPVLKYTFTELGDYVISLRVQGAGVNDLYEYKVKVEDGGIVADFSKFDLTKGIEVVGGHIWESSFKEEAILSFGIFDFQHYGYAEEGFKGWYGSIISNSTNSAFQSDYNDRMHGTMPEGGVDGKGTNYINVYADAFQEGLVKGTEVDLGSLLFSYVTINDDDNLYKASSVQVAMHPWAYYGIIDGDDFAEKFKEGDVFTLYIYGVDANNRITTDKPVEYNLVDFTNGVTEISKEWRKVDLSSLGEVKHLLFSLNSTDKEDYGLGTALYFSMDKLAVTKVSKVE